MYSGMKLVRLKSGCVVFWLLLVVTSSFAFSLYSHSH